MYSTPAVADGVVIVASNDKKVYALSAADGTKRWEYITSGTPPFKMVHCSIFKK